jgi:hypothetical protein
MRAVGSFVGYRSLSIYAPPLAWGQWYDLFEALGYRGSVTFDEQEKSDATTVFYEVQVWPSADAPAQTESAMPGVPFTTYQGASIRAYGEPTGTAVLLAVEW